MTRHIAAALGAAFALLPALASGTASADAPAGFHLDPTYGQAGRVIVPAAERAYPVRPAKAVLMHDGSLLVPSSRSVLRLGPDGTVYESFGAGGTITPPPAPGAGFEITGLAVDSQDRVLVAGTSSLPVQEEPTGEPVSTIPQSPRAARLMRFLPDGSIDSTFADQGVLETTFGLPVPLDPSGKPIGSRTWADATGVAVDSQDRVILTGGASAGLEFGCAHDWFWNTDTYAAFVARLTPAGALDPSFGGGDGFFGGHSAVENPLHAELSADPIPGPGGQVTYSGGGARCPRAGGSAGVAQLGPGGAPQPAFGSQGWLPGWFPSTVPGPDSSIVALQPLASKADDPRRVKVLAVDPDGSPSGVLHRRGAVVTPPGPAASELVSVAAGPEGGVLIGGTARRADAPGRTDPGKLLVTRVAADGRVDTRFGRNGRVATAFRSLTVRGKKLLLDGRGHALLVGSYRRGHRGGPGLVVARYVLGGD